MFQLPDSSAHVVLVLRSGRSYEGHIRGQRASSHSAIVEFDDGVANRVELLANEIVAVEHLCVPSQMYGDNCTACRDVAPLRR